MFPRNDTIRILAMNFKNDSMVQEGSRGNAEDSQSLLTWSRPKGQRKSAISGMLQMAAQMKSSQNGSSSLPSNFSCETENENEKIVRAVFEKSIWF